jgi:hypothetical protein
MKYLLKRKLFPKNSVEKDKVHVLASRHFSIYFIVSEIIEEK